MERDRVRSMVRDLLLASRFEERAGQAYSEGEFGGFLHLYSGEEAVAVGVLHAAELARREPVDVASSGDLAVAAPTDQGAMLTLTCDHRVVSGADAALAGGADRASPPSGRLSAGAA